MLDKIKRYYELGIYKKKHLDKLLEKEAITENEYKEIMGE